MQLQQNISQSKVRPKSRSRSNSRQRSHSEEKGTQSKKLSPSFTVNMKNIREVAFKLNIFSVEDGTNLYEQIQGKGASKPKQIIKIDKSYFPMDIFQDPRINHLFKAVTKQLNEQPIKKLHLILDFDETLINSICNKDTQTLGQKYSSQQIFKQLRIISLLEEQKEIVMIMRPMLNQFLADLSQLYTLYVYSHGRTNYVTQIQKNIDPNGLFFSREKFFTNTGSITVNSKKSVCNLKILDKDILKHTVIIDDQIEVWEAEQQDNIVPSKKFSPNNDEQPARRFLKFAFFQKRENEFVSLKLEMSKYYTESSLIEDEKCQLRTLRNFLIDAALRYYSDLFINNIGPNDVDIRYYLNTLRKKILLNVKVCFCFSQPLILDQKQFEEIAIYLGAQLENGDKSLYLLVDSDDFHLVQEQTIIIKKRNPSLIILDTLWITECFFQNYYVNPSPYKLG